MLLRQTFFWRSIVVGFANFGFPPDKLVVVGGRNVFFVGHFPPPPPPPPPRISSWKYFQALFSNLKYPVIFVISVTVLNDRLSELGAQ